MNSYRRVVFLGISYQYHEENKERSKSKIPDECKMPGLAGLDFPLKQNLLLLAAIDDQGLSLKEVWYRRNFVRLAGHNTQLLHQQQTNVREIDPKCEMEGKAK
jgi:hypothetical protein